MTDKKIQIKVTEVEKTTDLSHKLGDIHFNPLPLKKLLVVLGVLSVVQFFAFADQTGVTVALPNIGKDLKAETTINWAGTASLLANCVCQVLFGRLADIFGRKTVLISCILILSIADLACGFAQTGVQFFIFRAFSGIGLGACSSLPQVILSDVVTLKQRGRYQGILGSSVGVGNSVGPFIMAAFVKHYNWRGYYYFLCPVFVLVAILIYFTIDGTKKELDSVLTTKEKFKTIDYTGIITATISLVFILVPVSGGGSTYSWNSPIVISMFTIGGVFFFIFLLVEWKLAKLPMIPLELFKSPSLCVLLTSNFLFGAAYYGFLFYVPYHFNLVKQKDPIHTSAFMVALVMMQAVGSVVSGQLITYSGHYLFVILIGYALWCLSFGLCILWDQHLNDAVNIVVLLIMGTGVGFTFQPTMVACQAQSRKCDRAVVISTRNVLRSFGGAVGIAIGSTIVSNSLLNQLKAPTVTSQLSPDYIEYMKSHIYSHINTNGLNSDQVTVVVNMYVKSLRNYTYLLTPFIGVCLISNLFVRDRGLQCIDEVTHPSKKDLESSASSSMTASS